MRNRKRTKKMERARNEETSRGVRSKERKER